MAKNHEIYRECPICRGIYDARVERPCCVIYSSVIKLVLLLSVLVPLRKWSGPFLFLVLLSYSAQGQVYLSDLQWAPDSNYVILTTLDGEPRYMQRDTFFAMFQQAGAQDLGIVDSLLTITDGNSIRMTAENGNEVVFIDAAGSKKKYVFNATIPLFDEQQLSLENNLLTLTNGGSVDLTPYISTTIDTIYAVGNELRYELGGTTYSIVVEACEFCEPITATPSNYASITENIVISDDAEIDSSASSVTVIVSNASTCSDLTGHMTARAKYEIYGHQMAEYILYLEYKVDAGAWTRIAETEKEIYRNAGNYEEDFDVLGLLPVSIPSGGTKTYQVRAMLETVDTGYGTLFVVVNDATDAMWRSTEVRLDFLLSNDTN